MQSEDHLTRPMIVKDVKLSPGALLGGVGDRHPAHYQVLTRPQYPDAKGRPVDGRNRLIPPLFALPFSSRLTGTPLSAGRLTDISVITGRWLDRVRQASPVHPLPGRVGL